MIKIPLIKPYINNRVKEKVLEVLESRYLTEGPVTHEFEETFKNYIGCRHAIAVTSCTTGLELALRVLRVGPGVEAFSRLYVPATADVVSIVGATTVIVDISRDTMLVDYAAIERAITAKTKAIIPVSLFGNPLDYNRLGKIKKEHGVYILEDAACAVGAEFEGKRVGGQADIAVFSLHPRKFITTGEGGMVVTNSEEWVEWMESYKHFGMGANNSRSKTSFERVGTNYKLSNLLAAVGLAQMKEIDVLLKKRIALAERYTSRLKGQPNIILPKTTRGGRHSYQSYCVYVDNRDEVMRAMINDGVEVQIGTYALHMHPAFVPCDTCRISRDMTESRYAFDHCLTLPLYHEMTESEQDYVTEKLLNYAE